MRLHSDDPSLHLIELRDLDPPIRGRSEIIDRHRHALEMIVAWARADLCQPHPDLGRSGAVCPFVEGSLKRGLFFMAVNSGELCSSESATALAGKYRDWFLSIEPVTGPDAPYKTILILFPETPPDAMTEVIDRTQERLKPMFVEKGLMIGQFHSGPPPEPGLWNPNFRPLFAPIPLLAIRFMVPSDFPFLNKTARCVAAYLNVFGDNIPPRLRDAVETACANFGLPKPAP